MVLTLKPSAVSVISALFVLLTLFNLIVFTIETAKHTEGKENCFCHLVKLLIFIHLCELCGGKQLNYVILIYNTSVLNQTISSSAYRRDTH